jgi:hypothetical protein
MKIEKYTTTVFAIFLFFFLYIQQRYEDVLHNKTTDFLKDEDNMFVFSSLMILIMLNFCFVYILRAYGVVNVGFGVSMVTMLVVVAVAEGVIFKYAARGIPPF